MEDKEIIKALELCIRGDKGDCSLCPMKDDDCCKYDILTESLDLINRQKADIDELRKAKVVYETVDYCLGDLEDALKEIDEYKSEIAILKDSNKNLQELYCAEKEKVKKAKQKVVDACKNLQDAKAEVERLQKHIQEGIDLAKQIPEMVATAQAEAIKEFAERLKKKIYTAHFGSLKRGFNVTTIDPDDIDTLVKEMTGDQNND